MSTAPAEEIDLDHVPTDPADLARCLADPVWRVCSGYLYKIMIKSRDEKTGEFTMPFRPNAAQMDFLMDLWYRNLILKARQLGFTTLIAILWLDHALFNADQRCGIIAQDKEAAEKIFRDKVKYAYDNLPDGMKQLFPLAAQNKSELLFAHNNSSIRVGTSMRSGTLHRLHVSEFGKIGAHNPLKAEEVVTGSLPSVPIDGIAVIESTAEGQSGRFYEMAQASMKLAQQGKRLTQRDYSFKFYPWHENPAYTMEPRGVIITPNDHLYFEEVQGKIRRKLRPGQRAWYVATRDTEFSGDAALMWREYPSTPEESFQQSTEGTYYAQQLALARQQRRIGAVPHIPGIPVNTYWDIGSSDGTAIWFHQRVGVNHHWIRFIEGWGEPYSFYTNQMQQLPYTWGMHHLPHDALHRRQSAHANVTPLEMLQDLQPSWRFEIVPPVDEVIHGIQATRDKFSSCWFDETLCKEGLMHLGAYRKQWNNMTQTWRDIPLHDIHSEGADSFRQWGQSWQDRAVFAGSRPSRRNKGGMAA